MKNTVKVHSWKLKCRMPAKNMRAKLPGPKDLCRQIPQTETAQSYKTPETEHGFAVKKIFLGSPLGPFGSRAPYIGSAGAV